MAPVVTRLTFAVSFLVMTFMAAPGLPNDSVAKPPIQYRVSFRQADVHRIDIEVHIQPMAKSESSFSFQCGPLEAI